MNSILTHIERAEYYYIQGKTDSLYFNDVIYRCNQAYEGALKESYKVLANKSQEEVVKKTPNEIEKFLEGHNIFRDRVLQLFKTYRQEWRNKSTPDHLLFFDESEAFIALTPVTSFVHLLLKQIQEQIAFLANQEILQGQKEIIKKAQTIATSKNNPVDKLVDIIIEFAKHNARKLYTESEKISEVEIIGVFHAYMDLVGNIIETKREPVFTVGLATIRPDFQLHIDNQVILLELKKIAAKESVDTRAAIDQVLYYMIHTNVYTAVVYFVNVMEKNPSPVVIESNRMVDNKLYIIKVVIG